MAMRKGFFSRFTRSDPAVPPAEAPSPEMDRIVRDIVRQGLPSVPRKAAISLRLDADVLDWFRARGAGYQTRINAVLRAYMDASAE